MYIDLHGLLTDTDGRPLRSTLAATDFEWNGDDPQEEPRRQSDDGGDSGGGNGDGGGGDSGSGGGSDGGNSGDGGGGDGSGDGGDGSGGAVDQEIADLYNQISNSGTTSRGESFDQQDQDTQSMFQSVFGNDAASNWAREREAVYHDYQDQSSGGDFNGSQRSRSMDIQSEYDRTGRQPGPYVDAQGNIRTPGVGGPPGSAAAQALDMGGPYQQPKPYTDASGRTMEPGYGTPVVPAATPSSPPQATVGPETPTSPGTTQAVASKASIDTAVQAKAAGASDQEAVTLGASAAVAAALALDKRSLVGESQQTQAQFKQAYGDKAAETWAQQHNKELERNVVEYGSREPAANTPSLIPGVGPAPDRRIGMARPVLPAAPAAAGGVAVAPTRPGAPVVAAGAAPVAPPAEQPSPAQPAWVPTTPEELALAADYRDVQPFVGASALGPLVNTNDPLQAVIRAEIPNAVQNGVVDPEYIPNVAKAIAQDGPEANQYLTDIAQMAWYRERVSKGEQPEAPEMAPRDYVDGWKGLWRSGGTAPLTTSLRESLHASGFKTPAEVRAARPTTGPADIPPRDVVPPGQPDIGPGNVERPDAQAAPVVINGQTVPNPTVPGNRPAAPATADYQPVMSGNTQMSEIGPDGVKRLHWYNPVSKNIEALPVGTDPNAEAAPALTGHPEYPDVQAAPYVDAQGNTVPAMVTRNPQSGAVGGVYTNTPNYEPIGDEEVKYRGTPIPGSRLSVLERPGVLQGPARDDYSRSGLGVGLLGQALREANTPLTAVAKVQLAMEQGSPTLVSPGGDEQAQRHLAAAISSGADWAAPALENVARLAYGREMNGNPDEAPRDYINSWIGSWKNGEKPPLSDKLDEQLWDQGIRTVPGTTALSWQKQYGEDLSFNQMEFESRGLLTHAQAIAACGPAALVSFLRASGGRNPTPEEGLRLGRAAGWTGGAFPGPWKMQEQMKAVGMDVSDVEKADFAVINKEVDAGRPVVFDTSKGAEGHYFVVFGRDVQSGKYLVGGSGEALLGGNKWMSLPEMGRMGTPLHQIRLNSGNFVRELTQPEGTQARQEAPVPTGQVTGGGGSTDVQTSYTPGGAAGAGGGYNVWNYTGPVDVVNHASRNGTAPGEIEDFIARASQARGMDPGAVLELVNWEGGTSNPVKQNNGGSQAFGPLQLMRGGVGTQFERHMRDTYGVDADVRQPKWWKAATEFGIEKAIGDGGWYDWEAAHKRGTIKKGFVSPKRIGISDEALHYAGVR